jgi:thiamine biosynthesis protein ThiC
MNEPKRDEQGVRPALTPRDWQAIALRDAAEMCGTAEGAHRLVEARRYGALADEIDRLKTELGAPLTAERQRDAYKAALQWLIRWAGHKPLPECIARVRKALEA